MKCVHFDVFCLCIICIFFLCFVFLKLGFGDCVSKYLQYNVRAGRKQSGQVIQGENIHTQSHFQPICCMCLLLCTIYLHKKRTYNHSYLKRTHLHRATSAFVYKLFLLLMHLLLLCTSYFLLILRAIVASFYVPAITNHYKLG